MSVHIRNCPSCGCPIFDDEKMCPDCLTRVDMERPNKEDYKHFDDTQSIYPYCRDLETYCDEVEKALDKACEELSGKWSVNWEDERNVYSPEEWKEWLLNEIR